MDRGRRFEEKSSRSSGESIDCALTGLCCEPRLIFGAMDLGIPDHGHPRSGPTSISLLLTRPTLIPTAHEALLTRVSPARAALPARGESDAIQPTETMRVHRPPRRHDGVAAQPRSRSRAMAMPKARSRYGASACWLTNVPCAGASSNGCGPGSCKSRP